MRGTLAATIAFVLAPFAVCAQSTPNLSYGQVPTAGQWNAYFAAKQDLLAYTPLNRAGGTLLGKLNTYPSTINGAGFAIPVGIAPSAPITGDVWMTGAGLFVRTNAGIIGPLIQAGAASPPATVATLTTCATATRGMTAYVTDAMTPTYGAPLTAGGSSVVPAFCNGSAWVAY